VALKKSEKRLLMVLLPVLGFFLLDKLVLSSKSKQPAPALSPAAVQAAASLLKPPVPGLAARDTSAAKGLYRDWGRDPFASLSAWASAPQTGKGRKSEHPAEDKTVLSGIFRRQGKSFALINDQVYGEGEEINGIRVMRIDEDKVLCSAHGHPVTLYWRDLL
jgi:hypothetical protein